jgi:membrane protein
MRNVLLVAASVTRRAAVNFYRDNCLDRSATVAFYALLSLGPFLYLAGTTIALVFRGEAGAREAIEQISAFVPPAAVPLLESVVAGMRHDQGLVVLAIPGLVWTATSAFLSLEYAINVTTGTVARRKFWVSRLKVLLVLVAGWLLLGVSLVGGTVVPGLERLREALQLPIGEIHLPGLTSQPTVLLATFASFVLFYKLLPRGRIAWRAAAIGALPALALWETARHLFSTMLSRSPAFGLLTGTLAGVVAFLLWIYTAVAVILLGAEISAVINGNRDVEKGRKSVESGARATD